MITIVLFEPQIPPNTGCIARLCGANNVKLDIVGKIGFELTDKRLKRAGLDYWNYIDWEYHPNIDEYYNILARDKSFHLLTTKSESSYVNTQFRENDYIVFGSETKGISEKYLKKNWGNACTIPMQNKNIRSLNLATSVGIVLYEAIRQININK